MEKELNNQDPFVSVLTPVYNGEKYLVECIESVLAQTYGNWEYVIVNNQSTDRSLKIAQKYAAQDSRIKIHNNESHLPVLDNLNNTFQQMSSESKYCKVIHADDWMFPECVSKMVRIAETYPEVGIISSYRLVETQVGLDGIPYPSHHTPGKKICRDYLLHENYYFGAPSNILIRSDLIRKRDEIYNPEYLQSDITACLDLLQESDFGFVHQVLTFTRRHSETVTQTQAKKYSAHMFGLLKMMIDYGPVYLDEKEFRRRYMSKLNAFYIQFARDIYSHGFREVYQRHISELESLDLPFKRRKLAFYLFRELIFKFFNFFGYELKRNE